MTQQIHFLNGKYVTEDQLLISPRDLGYARGYAVFESLRTYNSRPFKLSDHIERLFQSANLISLQIPWSKEQIAGWILDTLSKNGQTKEEKMVRVIISGGVSHSLMPSKIPTIIIMIDPCHSLSEHLYSKGASLITARFARYTPSAKTNNYMEAVRLVQKAQEHNAIEALYYDDTQVFESSTGNIFALIDDSLLTPKTNVLIGVTREVVMHSLKLDIPVLAQDFSLNDLLRSNEVFLTGSIKEILPIVRIDSKVVGNGEVGPITRDVMQKFKDLAYNEYKEI